MTIDHRQLQDLEDRARHRGTGLQCEDILGCWQLTTIWPKGRQETNALSGWFLRSLGACLDISAGRNADLQLRNAVNLGPLCLQFQGPGHLRGRRPLLVFQFEQVELKLGQLTLLKRMLPSPTQGREPFFALISRSNDGWMAARGRGGGLALWTLKG